MGDLIKPDDRWLAVVEGTAADGQGSNGFAFPISLLAGLIVSPLFGPSRGPTSASSARRVKRRIDQGKTVTILTSWTNDRLVPEAVAVDVRSASATLIRRYQPDADLGSAYQLLSFDERTLPESIQADHLDLTWLKLDGRGGTRYLGADRASAALIAWCAGWPFPTEPTEHGSTP